MYKTLKFIIYKFSTSPELYFIYIRIHQDTKGSYTVDSESPLYKAKLKFEHAVSVKPCDHMPCYQLGRISLLLGDVATAEKCLKVAASIKPTHVETLLCLGKALAQSNPIQSKSLLVLGLGTYFQFREEVSEGSRCMHVTQLHGNEFWRPSNTIIVSEYTCILNLQIFTYIFLYI